MTLPAKPDSPWAKGRSHLRDLTITLEEALARDAQLFGMDKYLAGARIVEALRGCLGIDSFPDDAPAELRTGLNKIAGDLRTLARKFGVPVEGKGLYANRTANLAQAASVLRDAVSKYLRAEVAKRPESYPRGICWWDEEDARNLAKIVESTRAAQAHIGTINVLPDEALDQTAEQRIALFTDAIRGLARQHGSDWVPDAEDVVLVCARRCGNSREIFGAERKRVKRHSKR